mmetsp:Transcript_10805/g.21018  ORF Transcript_10805/g.21018 Transcript_10805/m.21018 type:complete len:413 (-) Transcript_10805:38-1276(-)
MSRCLRIGLLGALGANTLPARSVVQAAGPSTNFNPCSSIASGFKGIDSTNRVTYVECQDYQVVQSLDCSTGSYFDESTNQCVMGTWVDDSSVLGDVDPYCYDVLDGFVGLDSTNRVTYVKCSNYEEVGRYDCPSRFYFEQETESCVEGVWTADQLPSNGDVSFADENQNTCDNVSNGNVPLDSLRGYLVCNNGEVLVTEYCGTSTLYDAELGVCVNHCETSEYVDDSSAISDITLPNLAGSVTCDNAARKPIDMIVCSTGTHFDPFSGFCRNFCSGTSADGQMHFISFPGDRSGATCQNQQLVATIFCIPGTIYSVVRGICMQTDAPTLSPTSGRPTFHPVSEPPTVSMRPSSMPTYSLKLVVPVPEEVEEEEENEKKRPVQIESSAPSVKVPLRHYLRISLLGGLIPWLLV